MTDQADGAPRQTALLGELESIRTLLGEKHMDEIPVLSDVVTTEGLNEQQQQQMDELTALFSGGEHYPAEQEPVAEEADNFEAMSAEADEKLDASEVMAEAVDEEVEQPEIIDEPPAETCTEEVANSKTEEQDDLFPYLPDQDSKQASDDGEDFAVEPLIQNIIDEAMPAFETQLRMRLSQCAPEIIRQLAKQYGRD